MYSSYCLFEKVLQRYWPSKIDKSRLFSASRNGHNPSESFDSTSVFGPHVMATIQLKSTMNLELANRFLEGLIQKIGMTPITRAFGLYNQYTNPKFLSSIVMIAESHLSIHINLKLNTMYFDIFSCKMFDYASVQGLLENMGSIKSWHVVARGEKHDPRSSKRQAKTTISTKARQALNWWKETQ